MHYTVRNQEGEPCGRFDDELEATNYATQLALENPGKHYTWAKQLNVVVADAKGDITYKF